MHQVLVVAVIVFQMSHSELVLREGVRVVHLLLILNRRHSVCCKVDVEAEKQSQHEEEEHGSHPYDADREIVGEEVFRIDNGVEDLDESRSKSADNESET